MEDLFSNDENEVAVSAPMPDFGSEFATHESTAAEPDEPDTDVLSKLKDVNGAAKKRVLRPQPKLDPSRLNGERGLPILVTKFQGVKFKGKGNEAEDLKLLMNTLEHWAHRLFPKMTFDEVLARIEKLGMKREVQTTLKRIRLNMPLNDEDFVGTEQPVEGGDVEFDEADVLDAEAAYDEMMRQEQAAASSNQPDNHLPDEEEFDMMDFNEISDNHESENVVATKPVVDKSQASTPLHDSPSLSEEQKERMRRNRLRALEKKAVKLGVPVSTLSSEDHALNETEQQATQNETSEKESDTVNQVEITTEVADDSSTLTSAEKDETENVQTADM